MHYLKLEYIFYRILVEQFGCLVSVFLVVVVLEVLQILVVVNLQILGLSLPLSLTGIQS